jgi:hypothetical protein
VAQFKRVDFSNCFFMVGLRTYEHPGTLKAKAQAICVTIAAKTNDKLRDKIF